MKNLNKNLGRELDTTLVRFLNAKGAVEVYIDRLIARREPIAAKGCGYGCKTPVDPILHIVIRASEPRSTNVAAAITPLDDRIIG